MTLGLHVRAGFWRLLAVVLLLGSAAGTTVRPVLAQQPPAVELLMFEEAGCPWCRRWREEVGQGYPHTPEGKRAPVRNVDLHGSPPPGITLAAPVRFSPTFVLVAGGREVGRITGYPGADFFWPMLEALLARLDGTSRRQSRVDDARPAMEAS